MSTVPAPFPPVFMEQYTCSHLHEACLSEIRTRLQCLSAAEAMEEAHLHVIAHALRFTAAQDSEHEVIFHGLLVQQGGTLSPSAEQEALASHAPLMLLHTLIQEKTVIVQRYLDAVRTAQAEGYPRIATTFTRIAETETLHIRRFQQYAQAFADGSLFHTERPVTWLCMHCSLLHTGCEPPQACSGCGRDQGYFIRSNHYPFSVEG